MKKYIAILGGGSWGTALAIHLAKKHPVKVWEFVVEQAQEMQEKRVCPLLHQAHIPENVFISSKMEEVLPGCSLVLMVVPSDKVEATLENALPHLQQQSAVPLLICSKGFASRNKLLSEAVQEKYSGNVYCLYGPTHAEEVCHGKFSGIVLAGGKGKQKLKKMLEDDSLRVELSNDIIGVQIAASLKNILAIMLGILAGKGEGDNARAYVLTKGLEEIKTLGLKLGAKKETFYGLAGLGDMIVTCTSVHSRNFYVGEQVGKGRKLDEVLAEMKMVAEGVTSLKSALILAEQFHLKLPIIQGVQQILYENKDVKEILKNI
ncbi:MAG: NAD(P)H-dependent glycerol-3-phosphate dehydrogenase [Candidatus Woesearchaeota archaeon]